MSTESKLDVQRYRQVPDGFGGFGMRQDDGGPWVAFDEVASKLAEHKQAIFGYQVTVGNLDAKLAEQAREIERLNRIIEQPSEAELQVRRALCADRDEARRDRDQARVELAALRKANKDNEDDDKTMWSMLGEQLGLELCARCGTVCPQSGFAKVAEKVKELRAELAAEVRRRMIAHEAAFHLLSLVNSRYRDARDWQMEGLLKNAEQASIARGDIESEKPSQP